MITSRTAIIALLSLVTACAAEPSEPADAADSDAPTAAPAIAVDDSAVHTILKGGDFRFDLAGSSVFSLVAERCEKEAKQIDKAQRAKDVATCLKRMTVDASGEGVELIALGGNRMRYISYVHENGERKVHFEAKLTVAHHEPGIVAVKDLEVVSGAAPPPGAQLLLEVVDENTIAMDKQPGAHPRTGDHRLLFHRTGRCAKLS